MTFVWIMAAVAGVSGRNAPDMRPLFDAIRHVETGGSSDPANAVGDGGRSVGPYQIRREYWRDSGIPGKYAWVRNVRYAELVMLNYWRRHCPEALRRGDWQTLARVHNGGPDGDRDRRTINYWRRVQQQIRR